MRPRCVLVNFNTEQFLADNTGEFDPDIILVAAKKNNKKIVIQGKIIMNFNYLCTIT